MAKKELKPEHIVYDNLEDIMSDRFARYSKYIIQERALPDARDGLKPDKFNMKERMPYSILPEEWVIH